MCLQRTADNKPQNTIQPGDLGATYVKEPVPAHWQECVELCTCILQFIIVLKNEMKSDSLFDYLFVCCMRYTLYFVLDDVLRNLAFQILQLEERKSLY